MSKVDILARHWQSLDDAIFGNKKSQVADKIASKPTRPIKALKLNIDDKRNLNAEIVASRGGMRAKRRCTGCLSAEDRDATAFAAQRLVTLSFSIVAFDFELSSQTDNLY